MHVVLIRTFVTSYEFWLAARLKDTTATAADAEIMAVASAINLDSTYRRHHNVPEHVQTVIYTDHLATARRFQGQRANRPPLQPGEPSRPYTRYLSHLFDNRANVRISYQEAHTTGGSEPATLNRAADQAAHKAHSSHKVAAPSWGHTDRFTLFDPKGQPSHAHPASVLGTLWDAYADAQVSRSGNVYHYTQPWLFLHAQTAYTARVQHLTRANALPTAHWRVKYGLRPESTTCDLCTTPGIDADVRHVFIYCDGVSDIRAQFHAESERTIRQKSELNPGSANFTRHLELTQSLINDSNLWIGGLTLFYKGEMPAHFEYDDNLTDLYNALSGLCMMTAAQIWGRQVQGSLKYERRPGTTDVSAPKPQTRPSPRKPPQTRAPDLRRGQRRGRDRSERDRLESGSRATPDSDTEPGWEIDPIHGFGNPNIVKIVRDLPSDNDNNKRGNNEHSNDNSDDLY